MYNDIYSYLGTFLVNKNWYFKDFNTQKELLELGFKSYIISKINILEPNLKTINSNLSLIDLYLILSNLIPKENHFNTLRFFTHYLLSIISNLQNYEIIWLSENINNISITIDDFHKWNTLTSNDDYINSFISLYYCFKEYFNKDILIKKLEFTRN